MAKQLQFQRGKMEGNRIKLLIADNEEIFRQGLVCIFKGRPNIEIVGQSTTGEETIEKSRQNRPDIVLLNSRILECAALEVLAEINKSLPGTKVVTMSHPEALEDPLDLVRAGAWACLSRLISADDLVKSLELIHSGRIIISRFLARAVIQEIRSLERDDDKKERQGKEPLSDRQLEIVKFIAHGRTNKEIAQELAITENTVKGHVKNILEKLELRNRQQLAVYAFLRNWVTHPNESQPKTSQTR